MGLDDDPFSWAIIADGSVRVFRAGRLVSVVSARKAGRLREVLEGDDPEASQQALARATGNYRRGNERRQPRG